MLLDHQLFPKFLFSSPDFTKLTDFLTTKVNTPVMLSVGYIDTYTPLSPTHG